MVECAYASAILERVVGVYKVPIGMHYVSTPHRALPPNRLPQRTNPYTLFQVLLNATMSMLLRRAAPRTALRSSPRFYSNNSAESAAKEAFYKARAEQEHHAEGIYRITHSPGLFCSCSSQRRLISGGRSGA